MLTKEQLSLQWLNGLGSEADVQNISFDERIWLWKQLDASEIMDAKVKSNNLLTLMRLLMRDMKDSQSGLWYAAIVRTQGERGRVFEFPYQESSRFGSEEPQVDNATLRIFGSRESAARYCDKINRTVRASSSVPSTWEVVRPYQMGNDIYNSYPLQEMERMGVNTLLLGDTDLTVDLKNMVELHKQTEDRYEYSVAPRCFAAQAIHQQMILESASKEIQGSTWSNILIEAMMAGTLYTVTPMELMLQGIDVSSGAKVELGNGRTVRAIYVFTDLQTLQGTMGKDTTLVLMPHDMEDIYDMDEGILFDEDVYFSRENMEATMYLTDKASLALQYLTWCYREEEPDTSDVECRQALTDILSVSDVRKEFYAGLRTEEETDPQTQEVRTRVIFDFPDDLMEVMPGVTAKRLLDTRLCMSPAAAYRVMAVLAKDTDGSAKAAFERAELYR